MKKILCMLFVLLFLVGCGTTTTVDVDESSQEVAEEAVEEEAQEVQEMDKDETIKDDMVVEDDTVKEQAVVDYSLSATERDLLDSRFAAGERAELSRPLIQGLQAGDVYVAGLGITNIFGQATHEFLVSFDFVEMRDYSNSMHDSDDKMLEGWFDRTEVGPYIMKRDDTIVVPLIIEVGDETTSGVELLPGNYIFDVTVGYMTDSGWTDEYEKIRLTIQVAE